MIQPFSRRSTNPRPPMAARRPRILIAEDDDEMRRLLAECLACDDYDIVEAHDGAQLVDRLTTSLRGNAPVDLVITDLRMPVLGGFEAVEWFRALGCRAPVIVITAFADRRTDLESVRLGVARVLDKPFDFDELRQVVRELFMLRPRFRGSA